MNPEEEKEYEVLMDKRNGGNLTNKEYKRYLILLDKAFLRGIPKVLQTLLSEYK